MTRPTSHTGSGFSSSRGGDSGSTGVWQKHQGGVENMALAGQKGNLVPAAHNHGAGTTVQCLQEEEANEGNGAQCERYLQFLGLQRGTPSA